MMQTTDRRNPQIAAVFALQLGNSVVHHTTHALPVVASISIIDIACTLILMVSLVYLGFVTGRAAWPIASGALWALLLWLFGVCASATVMRLVDPASMESIGVMRAALAALVLAPIALALGALGAWCAMQQVVR